LVQDEEFQFNLTRLLQKISQFVKSKPEVAKKFYTDINHIYDQVILDCETTLVTGSTLSDPKIKNPLVIKSKGRPSNRRIKSSSEKKQPKKNLK
jgi:hypothetical protein